MMCLDKPLRSAVTQHANYDTATSSDDIVKLWDIVKDCATGSGAHSVYVTMTKCLSAKMEGTSSTDYTEYIRKYNDLVADVKQIATDAEILEKLFNAKFSWNS
jgi:hypothetical protein